MSKCALHFALTRSYRTAHTPHRALTPKEITERCQQAIEKASIPGIKLQGINKLSVGFAPVRTALEVFLARSRLDSLARNQEIALVAWSGMVPHRSQLFHVRCGASAVNARCGVCAVQ